MLSDKLLLNTLKNFEVGTDQKSLISNTYHSDYDFIKHPKIEVKEAIDELIHLGILEKHEHTIQSRNLEPSFSLNFQEILKRMKVLDYILEYNAEWSAHIYQYLIRKGMVGNDEEQQTEGGLS